MGGAMGGSMGSTMGGTMQSAGGGPHPSHPSHPSHQTPMLPIPHPYNAMTPYGPVPTGHGGYAYPHISYTHYNPEIYYMHTTVNYTPTKPTKTLNPAVIKKQRIDNVCDMMPSDMISGDRMSGDIIT